MAIGVTNWSGNYAYQATKLHRPASVDELRTIVARAPKIHVLGSRHCFNDIADSAELISLDAINFGVEIDRSAMTVTVGSSVTYGELARALEREGFALHNMASLPHISVGGATATATHGSGDGSGNLATAVAALELVTSDGEIQRVARGEADFAGLVVNLGALGVVTRLTLDIEPSYLMRQQVFEHLAWDVLLEQFDAVTSGAYSVSLFTDYGADVDEVWLKSRVAPGDQPPLPRAFFGAQAATKELNPVPRLSPENCTAQLGAPGAWMDRLPHFRMDAVPASGAELQTEYMIPRRFAVAALRAVRDLAPQTRPHLWTSEIRTVAGDDLWLSTAYGTDVVGIHFSWKSSDPGAVDALLPVVESTLAPFAPRPHWGKLFLDAGRGLGARYERLPEFRRLAARLDPRGAFRNAFLDRHIFDDAPASSDPSGKG